MYVLILWTTKRSYFCVKGLDCAIIAIGLYLRANHFFSSIFFSSIEFQLNISEAFTFLNVHVNQLQLILRLTVDMRF